MLELLTLPTIADALPAYAQWLRSRKLSDRSIETYLKDLRTFTTWLEGQIGEAPSIGDITQETIERYQEGRAHLAARSLIKTLTALRSFSRWCARPPHRYRVDDPTAAIDWPRKTVPLPRALTSAELRKLEAALAAPLPSYGETRARRVRQRDRLAVLIGLYAGARLNEQVNILWSDVDLVARTLVITKAKGNKQRQIPIHPRLYAALNAVPEAERVGYVIGLKGGRKLNAKSLAHLYDRSCSWLRTDYGLEISSHRLRHTFATQALNAGADIRTVQELLGHNDLSVTANYLRVVDSGKRTAIELLPERFAEPDPITPEPRTRKPSRPPHHKTQPRTIVCLGCGKEAPNPARGPQRRFCDRSCKIAYYSRLKREERAAHPAQGELYMCAHCGKEGRKHPKRPEQRYCSESCRNAAQKAERRAAAIAKEEAQIAARRAARSTTCTICGAPIQQPAAGRPRSTCSDGCRTRKAKQGAQDHARA